MYAGIHVFGARDRNSICAEIEKNTTHKLMNTKKMATNIYINTHSPFIYYGENRPHEFSLFIKYKTQICICFLSHSRPRSQKTVNLNYRTFKCHFQWSMLGYRLLSIEAINSCRLICSLPNRKIASEFAVLPIRHVRRKVQCDMQTMRWPFFPKQRIFPILVE